MDKLISSIVKSCFLYLCDIRRICPFISKTAAIALANAFVHSHLDFCNSLFYGLPKYTINQSINKFIEGNTPHKRKNNKQKLIFSGTQATEVIFPITK